jgi:hypothetical protein
MKANQRKNSSFSPTLWEAVSCPALRTIYELAEGACGLSFSSLPDTSDGRARQKMGQAMPMQ